MGSVGLVAAAFPPGHHPISIRARTFATVQLSISDCTRTGEQPEVGRAITSSPTRAGHRDLGSRRANNSRLPRCQKGVTTLAAGTIGLSFEGFTYRARPTLFALIQNPRRHGQMVRRRGPLFVADLGSLSEDAASHRVE